MEVEALVTSRNGKKRCSQNSIISRTDLCFLKKKHLNMKWKMAIVTVSTVYNSLALEVELAPWCHQCPQESPATAFHLRTDCWYRLSYKLVTVDFWISSVYFLHIGSHHSAVKEHIVRKELRLSEWWRYHITDHLPSEMLLTTLCNKI